ncbi:MAG: cyclase family protein, partial [Bryobacteraceae bacterium]
HGPIALSSTMMKNTSAWIDISVPLHPAMVVWPGDAPPRFERVAAIALGAPNNTTAASFCLHTGTHVDAPLHCLEGGAGVERMPLEATIGPARIIGIRTRRAITAADLQAHRIRRGERILFKTHNSALWRSAEFSRDYVHLAKDAAELLAARGVRTVGIDYLSIGAPNEEGGAVHRILLRAGVWIIEGLDLSRIPPGRYELVCLPLRVPGADGAPARAAVRRAGKRNRLVQSEGGLL